MTAEMEHYTISQLAQEFKVTTRTIRFYEAEGLLNPKRQGQTRIYTNRSRTRLKLILRGKRLGLSLSEIREILHIYDYEKDEAKQLNLLVDKIKTHRKVLEQQRKDIDIMLTDLHNAEQHCAEILARETSNKIK